MNSVIYYFSGTGNTLAVETVAAEVQLHSDQGFQYTSQAYFTLTQQYGITPSMSRRGNYYDSAVAENIFSILKTECIYRVSLRRAARLGSS